MSTKFNISEYASQKLDISRAVAALMVLIGHFRGSYFMSFNELEENSKNIFNFILFAFTRIGHQCVIVFFVLSGFLVGGISISKVASGYFSGFEYLSKRLTRMYVVLIPALIFGGILDYTYILKNMNLDVSLKTFIGNVFFMQTILVPVYGSNGPLWSLAYEFWYYIMFLIVILCYLRLKNNICKYIVIIGCLILFSILVPKIMILFPIWLLGCVIPLVPKYSILKKNYLYVFWMLFLAPFILFCNYFESIFTDYLLGLYFCVLIVLWLNRKKKVNKNLYYFKIIADFSFTMYAIHSPVITFFENYCNQMFPSQRLTTANLYNWLGLILFVFLICIISYLIYFLTEKNTSKVRGYVVKKLIFNSVVHKFNKNYYRF
ncbi:acyltransferase [Flavobacterium sp. NG2]|uniref:acyltransferase family protein n=1 Tax=Flavobacterium sp. NG2 TaxID=3097547 RepID=UPI002A823984|nr:acyltransferase [Flavobacterium sp. NG2]WPR71651.1 acyltransferase [Flavobacterium sp. NG2]